MELAYSFTVALFLTIALIPMLIRFSASLQLVDDPDNDRKVHDRVIPRSGGLAIVLGVFIPLFFVLPINDEFFGLILGAVSIVIFGYFDDRYELDYKWKFLGQIIAVIAVMVGGVTITQIPLMGLDNAPLWLSLPLTFFFLLGAINAVNLTDGLDGLAAGTSLFSLAIIVVFGLQIERPDVSLVAATVIGGLLGFLRYNTFPARIFMGDTGSQFLGYIVACLALIVSQSENAAMSPAIPLIILGLPILDTLTVMSIRLKEKRSPFSPDKNHLHHQLMSLGFKHFEAVAVIYVIQVTLIASAYFLRFESDLLILIFYTLFSTFMIAMLYVSHVNRWLIREPFKESVRDRRNRLLRRMDWLYYHFSRVIEYVVSIVLVLTAYYIGDIRADFSMASLFLAVCLTMFFILRNKFPNVLARVCCYTASVFSVYLYTTSLNHEYQSVVDSAFILLALLLILAIRMTRREDFSLDTQDLLVLVLVVLVPQLPFETLSENSVGNISLRLAVLMYGCELVLGSNKTKFRALIFSSILSLFLIGLPVLTVFL